MSEKKIALVTGASRGIGAEIAKQFGRAGYTVCVNYASNADAAVEVAFAIRELGADADIMKADITNEAEADEMFNHIKEKYGRLDVLVNNAGTYSTKSITAFDREDFSRQFDLNVYGLLLCCSRAVNLFGEKGGSIVNIGSSVTSFTPPNSVVYTATKSAVDSITKTLSKELGPKRIRVNSVNPGLVVTEGMLASSFAKDEFQAAIIGMTPAGRIGCPEDIAPAVVFLASEAASWISGEILLIGGGLH